MDRLSPEELLQKASAGDRRALGHLLERYRAAIHAEAENQMNRRIGARMDASDIVQETFLEAHRDFDSFRGSSEVEWHEWLSRILSHNIIEAIRRHDKAKKRSVRAEKSLQDELKRGFDFHHWLADMSNPGQKAIRNEQFRELQAAIQTLPHDQQEVIRMRYLEGRSLAEISNALGRTERAVASLIYRAVKELQRKLS